MCIWSHRNRSAVLYIYIGCEELLGTPVTIFPWVFRIQRVPLLGPSHWKLTQVPCILVYGFCRYYFVSKLVKNHGPEVLPYLPVCPSHTVGTACCPIVHDTAPQLIDPCDFLPHSVACIISLSLTPDYMRSQKAKPSSSSWHSCTWHMETPHIIQ